VPSRRVSSARCSRLVRYVLSLLGLAQFLEVGSKKPKETTTFLVLYVRQW